jgi:hypothetical protein
VQHGDGGKEEESWHDVEELRIEQKLDHHPSAEQPASSLTLSQRYFYSSRYVNASSTDHALAFLCVGGEGPSLDKSVLVDSVHCTGDMLELAAKLFHVSVACPFHHIILHIINMPIFPRSRTTYK